MITKKQKTSLRRKLENIYEIYSDQSRLSSDPLGVLSYDISPADFEINSFVLAGLSYGRVEQIYKSYLSLIKNLSPLGVDKNGANLHSIFQTIPSKDIYKETQRALKNWKHRLNTSEDIAQLFFVLSTLLKTNASLAHLFFENKSPSGEDRLLSFVKKLESTQSKIVFRSKQEWGGTGAQWFYASPAKNSSCKRLLMWLRWMIRKDAIDPGTWRSFLSKEQTLEAQATSLFWPIDTHIHKWVLSEGLSTKKNVSWRLTKEITDIAKQINAEDPIKYDFSICQAGMEAFRKTKG